jgi:hypothetical protein
MDEPRELQVGTDTIDPAEAARALSRLGARAGGEARARSLSPAERRQQASEAARVRWAQAGRRGPSHGRGGDDELPFSMFRGTLEIGDVTFECHHLSDDRRVLTQREVVRVLTGGRDSSNIQRYLERNRFVPDDYLDGRIIEFRVPGSATIAHGYEATVLIEICDFYLELRDQGPLKRGQAALCTSAGIVVRACAKVGIIALIDEATGYQQVRERRALQLKLQAFIAEEMQEWVKMFPDEFWYELARLEGVHYSPRHRPLRWGKYVMMFVYDAIDPDVGRQLRKKNPDPHFRKNHHQWLKDFGRDRLNNQLQQVIAVMKMCDDMDDFRKAFAKVFRKGPLQLELELA